ncbi:MAG: DNA double-strand break repair nuclease NurA [Dehalococcoidia bacterium]|nr:DNA double-strand break repair nuclease NurA [Dehalococcoidia bacterium]
MTLRLEQVAGELPAFVERYRQGLVATQAGIGAAHRALGTWAGDRAGGDARIRAAMAASARPYALSAGEPPTSRLAAPTLGPLSVVAADGSSIEPDRFAPVQCYVINTGFVLLPYGVGGRATLGAQALLGPEAATVDGEDDGGESGGRGLGVNLLRDVMELEMGESVAAEALAWGPAALLLDGTLLPWDLDSRQVAPEVREAMQRRTEAALGRLRAHGDGLSLGAYVSGSRGSDVVTSLRALTGGEGAWPLADAQLFAGLLGDGERSAVFRATSQRSGTVEELPVFREHPVWFFYLRVGGDLARVEVPGWGATSGRVGRLHAAIVDQCARCGGYPRALQEAHEQAVISAGDRLQFARLLENEAARQRLPAQVGGKQMSKRRRAI